MYELTSPYLLHAENESIPAFRLSTKVAEQSSKEEQAHLEKQTHQYPLQQLESWRRYRKGLDRSRLVLFVDIQYGRQDLLRLYGNGSNTYRRDKIEVAC